jgi:hypothetical protein
VTETEVVLVAAAPTAFVTVNETWYVSAAVKVWLVVAPVATGVPSPKFHVYELIELLGAVDALPSKLQVRAVHLMVKAATGCGTGTTNRP